MTYVVVFRLRFPVLYTILSSLLIYSYPMYTHSLTYPPQVSNAVQWPSSVQAVLSRLVVSNLDLLSVFSAECAVSG